MRQLFIAAALVISALTVHSQENEKPTVEKNMFAVNVGIVSVGFQYEGRLARKWALHAETGISLNPYTVEYFSSDSSIKKETEYLSVPYFSIEPRYYYGLDRRQRHGRNTKNNSSNYISLKSMYMATEAALTNSNERFEPASALLITPSYGIRRSFAKTFFYEFCFGVGLQHNFQKNTRSYSSGENEAGIDIQAKIGYTF